jgi:hypothetical protein
MGPETDQAGKRIPCIRRIERPGKTTILLPKSTVPTGSDLSMHDEILSQEIASPPPPAATTVPHCTAHCTAHCL